MSSHVASCQDRIVARLRSEHQIEPASDELQLIDLVCQQGWSDDLVIEVILRLRELAARNPVKPSLCRVMRLHEILVAVVDRLRLLSDAQFWAIAAAYFDNPDLTVEAAVAIAMSLAAKPSGPGFRKPGK